MDTFNLLRKGTPKSTCELTGRLELKVVDVPPGKLKVRSLLGLAGAVEEHQAVRLVDDKDESPVVDVAIVDAACGAGHPEMLPWLVIFCPFALIRLDWQQSQSTFGLRRTGRRFFGA